jgi:hypothetical protein
MVVGLDRVGRRGGALTSGSSPVPSPVRRMLREAELAYVVRVGDDGWPVITASRLAWDGSRIALPDDIDVGSTSDEARAVAVLVDLGTRFDELRGALMRGPVRSGQPAAGTEVTPERTTWWDLAHPEGR